MNVSVVIPNYNGKHLLEKHLPHVLTALSKDDEVIVVDDASTDNSAEYLSMKYPHVKVVKNEKNVRFAESCNVGVLESKHEIIVLLNNDVSPEKEFLKPLLTHFKDQDVFSVGCLEIDRDGKESGRSIGFFQRGMLSHKRADNQHNNTTLWTSGGSMAVRKSAWLALGGLDPLFRPAYKEDIDLSYRAVKAGWKIRFEPGSKVRHEHESTNIVALGKEAMTTTSYKNEFLFLWKNLTDLDLVISHIFWLVVYLLPIVGVQTKGQLYKGFFQALSQSGELFIKRQQVKKLWKLSDKEVIQTVEQ